MMVTTVNPWCPVAAPEILPIAEVADVEKPKCVASTDSKKFLSILHPYGCYEIRIPDCPSKKGSDFKRTAAGYFVDHEKASRQIKVFGTKQPKGIYVSLNPVDGNRLLARSANAIDAASKIAAGDDDILKRRWILIDIDPKRDGGTSATDAENKAAKLAAKEIKTWLASRGFPTPLRAMSGNGAYLIYRVDLLNDGQAKELVTAFLTVLGDRFNSECVDVDHSVFNASRILKVPGTWARKGSNFVGVDGYDDRPHRLAWFVDDGQEIEVVDRALIESLVVEFAKPKADTPKASVSATASQLAGFSTAYKVKRCLACIASIPSAVAGDGGSDPTLQAGATIERFALSAEEGWPLMLEYNSRCVPAWEDRDLERKMTEGMRKAAERGETGRALLEKRQQQSPAAAAPAATIPRVRTVEPGTEVIAGDRDNVGTVVSDDGDSCTVRFVSPEGNTATKSLPKSELSTKDGKPLVSSGKPSITFAGVDAKDLAKYVDMEADWLVDGIFSADQPTVFGAASKATKTTQLVDLSVSLATTTPWLGHFPVSKRRKVLFITGESNYRAASKRIKRALDVRGFTWSDVSEYLRVEAIEFPSLPSATDQAAITRDVKDHGIDVVIIDPLYRGLTGVDLFKMNEMGSAIIQFVKACQPASVIISHHIVKAAAREMGQPTLEDLSGAGLAESAGNWWLIGRNGPYAFDRMHDLSVVYGGRDEQAGLLRVVFNEAEWTAEVTSGHDVADQRAKDAQNKKQQAKESQVREARAGVLHSLANEQEPKSKSWVEDRSGHPQKVTRLAIAELLNDLSIVEQSYTDARNHQLTGLILAKMASKEAAL